MWRESRHLTLRPDPTDNSSVQPRGPLNGRPYLGRPFSSCGLGTLSAVVVASMAAASILGGGGGFDGLPQAVSVTMKRQNQIGTLR